MTPTEKAIAKIEAHERECAIRYEGIEKRLESGSKRYLQSSGRSTADIFSQ